MRILASNPDTIGDMVLRQPLYRALLDAGHELTLIVRPSVEPIVQVVAPGAKTLVLPQEVYAPIDDRWEQFEPVVNAAREINPNLLLIAPYQWTRFDERLAADLRKNGSLQVVGMSGHLYGGDPFAGPPPKSDLVFDRQLQVDEDVPEADKNALLADMLGCPVSSVDPVIAPDETALTNARQILSDHGLEPGGYWIACVTGTANVPIKAWPAECWAEVLRQWHEQYGRRFLFIGLPAERSVVDLVLAGMGPAADRCAVWMEPGNSITTLAALASLSQGYAGHDTGPMHIAAAVGKPVLAIFGGGHKLRFTPRVKPSIVLSVRVPCAGCGWACSFDQAYCVTALRPTDVLRAVEDLEVGRISTCDVRLLALPQDTHAAMTAYAADLARDRLRMLSSAQRQLDQIDAGQLVRLTQERQSLIDHAEGLRLQLAAAVAQVNQLHAAHEAIRAETAGLHEQLQEREAAVVALRAAVDEANQRTVAEAAARQAEVEPLRKELEHLKHRLAAMEPKQPVVTRVRKSRRERIVDVVCGTRHYEPKGGVRPMPMIRLVTRIKPEDQDTDVRRTVDSVLSEAYPHFEYVLIADADRPVVQTYADRVNNILRPGERPFDAVADAFADTNADVVAFLDVGQAYEPGALMRAGEFFRDHSLAMAATFEASRDLNGWRFPVPPSPVDVASLRQSPGPVQAHVFFRRQAYSLLGPIDPAKGYAADWDLVIRFARRFGIRRGHGSGVCLFQPKTAPVHADYVTAAEAFDRSFGAAGRFRVGLLHTLGKVAGKLRRRQRPALWATTEELPPSDFCEAAESGTGPLVSPLTHRRPDRLLMAGRDVMSGDKSLHRVYYDRKGDIAVTAPRIDRNALDLLHASRQKLAKSSPTGSSQGHSPYQRFRGGPAWVRLLESLPSPYWRLAGCKSGYETPVSRLLSLVGPTVAQNPSIRALFVGCYDGALLDDLKRETRWTVAGLETNAEAADKARAKGHTVWQCSPQDAFMTIPDGQMFDLIFVPDMLERWEDPAWAIRRLTRILSPSGRLVIRTPNLNSMLVDRFGPTWWHWQLPYHRVLLGRRGLRNLARATDLKIERLQTITDAYNAAASVQLNEIGLAGVVPEGAAFEPAIASRGAKLAGWARMSWDRWGRGDEMWAVLRPL